MELVHALAEMVAKRGGAGSEEAAQSRPEAADGEGAGQWIVAIIYTHISHMDAELGAETTKRKQTVGGKGHCETGSLDPTRQGILHGGRLLNWHPGGQTCSRLHEPNSFAEAGIFQKGRRQKVRISQLAVGVRGTLTLH